MGRFIAPLCGLDRRAWPEGDHRSSPGTHDDLSNAVAAALVFAEAMKAGGLASNVCRLRKQPLRRPCWFQTFETWRVGGTGGHEGEEREA